MDMISVESSNVSAVGHDGSDLYVEFNNGSQYKYSDVPYSTYEDLIAAESVGRFLNQNIKGAFPHERLA